MTTHSEMASVREHALVTGASRGIGQAIALKLAQQGYAVTGTATSQEGAQAISQRLSAFKGCSGAVLNVQSPAAQLQEFIVQAEAAQGPIAVLVNNAGITRDGLALRMKDSDWDAVVDTNLSAVFRMSRAVMKGMMKQRNGRIVNITSVVGAMGNAGQANYAAAKAGVAGMTRALARELASRHITVNCVAPGFIQTDMTDILPAEQKAVLLEQIPAGRLGLAQEIAAAVAFLVSKEAAYITGVELPVNGGMHMV